MELHDLLSVTALGDGNYIAEVDITDVEGERYVANYGVIPGDEFGLAPTVRQAVEAWIAQGNTLLEPPEPTPEEIRASLPALTARQFRLGLIEGGFSLSDVEDALAAISDPVERQKGQVEWEYATQFNRLHPLVVQLSETLGLTPEQVDDLWATALNL